MTYAPILPDELDPLDSHLIEQRYISRYIDLCRQLGCPTFSLNDAEIRCLDAQVAQAAKQRGLSPDEIELTIWYGSQLARRLDDGDRDIYARSPIDKNACTFAARY
jgi:hypothetical protein